MSIKIPLSAGKTFSVEETATASKYIIKAAKELAFHGLNTKSAELSRNYFGLPMATLKCTASIDYIPLSARHHIEGKIQAKINRYNVIFPDINKENHYFTTIFPK